jgi:hypothetical protein
MLNKENNINLNKERLIKEKIGLKNQLLKIERIAIILAILIALRDNKKE